MEAIDLGLDIVLLVALFTVLHVVVSACIWLLEDLFSQFGWIGCILAGFLYCLLGFAFMPILIGYLVIRAYCRVMLLRD